MRILKIKGTNETIINEQIKKEYGDSAIIISKQEEKNPGIIGFLKKKSIIITVAVEDEENQKNELKQGEEVEVIDENEISIPKNKVEIKSTQMMEQLQIQIEELKQDINEVKKINTTDIIQKNNTEKLTTLKKEEISENNYIKPMINSLKEEGVSDEVCKYIFENLDKVEDIGTLAHRLYDNMMEILPVAKNELVEPIIFFVGATGVGKTTTLAKITADQVLNKEKKIVLFTADTYRIAAIEQLRTYAEILDVPIETIYSKNDLKNYKEKWNEAHHIFIDVAGRSHKNHSQIEEIKELLESVEKKHVYLVITMSTNYKDAKKIIDVYKNLTTSIQLIITKMDETDDIGNLMNIAYYAKCPIAYVTVGQNVPDDIEPFQQDEYVKKLLGRIKYE
ncbi:MAG: hypothetical protein ACRCSG_03205 [Cellulosilyticaceae bacterium]